MTNWIDTIVVGIVIVAGLFVLYKPLKEPIDRLFGGIKKLIINLSGRAREAKESTVEVINYG